MRATAIVPSARYGRLLVVCEAARRRDKNGKTRRFVQVACDCGKNLEVPWKSLPTGNTKSCGCFGIEQRRSSRRVPDRGAMVVHGLFVSRRAGAKKRGHVWELSEKKFTELIFSPCYYTGRLPSQVCKVQTGDFILYNGIDRKNNEEGYTVTNCVPCCNAVNYGKRALSESEFLKMITEVYFHSVCK